MGVITVLAGTNGAGKSSIGGALVRRGGGAYYNPDDETRAILVANPGLDAAQANGLAWTKGLENLRNAISDGLNVAFADGHVSWRNKDSLTRFVQFYSSAATTRLWW